MSIGNLGWAIFPFIVWWYILGFPIPKTLEQNLPPKKLDMDIFFA